MRARAIALTGAVAYAIFLVATIPSSWLAARVASESAGAVELQDPRGTVWSGNARAIVASAAGRVVLDDVRWRFAPAELAAGRLGFDLALSGRGLEAKARIGRGFSEWAAGSVAASLDASLAAAAVPLLAAWRPEGRVQITAGGLRWNDSGQASGSARLTWDRAALSLSDVKPMGRYALDAAADHGPASLALTTLEGPLRVSGRGTFSPPSRVVFSGEARGDGPDAAALDPLLNLIGPRRADGSRAIELRLGAKP